MVGVRGDIDAMLLMDRGDTKRKCCIDKLLGVCKSCEDARVSELGGRVRLWCAVDKKQIPVPIEDNELGELAVDYAYLMASSRLEDGSDD